MQWLTNITFRRDGAGGVDAVLPDGVIEHSIRFVQLFPLRNPGAFVAVICNAHDNARKRELGIIEDLAQLPPPQRQLVQAELRHSFLLPEIETIRKIVTTGGVDEWHVTSDRGAKVLFICDRKQSIHVCDDGMLLVTDMDKCRYRITHPEQLDALSQYLLERAMP
jgi:hypothetical protein